MGEAVCVVPCAHFVGYEEIHTAFSENLRQYPGVSEDIGQEAGIYGYAESFPEIVLTVKALTDKTFSGGNIAVRLNVHSSDDFKCTGFYFERSSRYFNFFQTFAPFKCL